MSTFFVCYLEVRHPEARMLRDVKPHHIEEYKRLRAAGEIVEQVSAEHRKREQDLRLQVGKLPAEKRGEFGFLGARPIKSKHTAQGDKGLPSQRTVNYELRCMFTFCHWAKKNNFIFQNPAANVERFRLPKRALPKFLTSDELHKFFAACDDADRRLFMFFLLTGMRLGEVIHLCWTDINLELGIIFVQEKPEFGWKPKTDERVIPISPALHGVIHEQYASRRSDKLVFANTSGNVDTHVLERLKKICKRAVIREATVHQLRHSFGAHLRMAGVSLADIADLLGHRDLATTQIYARVMQEHLRSMVAKLGALVTPSGPMEQEMEQIAPAGKEGNPKLLTN